MILGLRCSSTDYYYVVLTGTKAAPEIASQKSHKYPHNLKKPASLKWMLEEIRDLLQRFEIEKVVFKAAEPLAMKNSSLVERVEYEAAAQIACAQAGLKAVFKKVKNTISKDLGMKGKAKYLQTLDTSPLAGYTQLPEKGKEAALAAWTELD
jgi:predicted xylose isomerase-like sugar epimerase